MVFPNPHKRFCLDLRPRVAGQWDSFLESGYLHEGRLAHASKTNDTYSCGVSPSALTVARVEGDAGGGDVTHVAAAPLVSNDPVAAAPSADRAASVSTPTTTETGTTTVNNTPSTATGGTLSPATTSPHQSAADGGTGARMPGVDALQAASRVRRKVRKAMATRLDAVRNTRITINRDFRGALYRMREYHHTHRKGTWFDLDFIEFMAELQETDELNASGSMGHTAAGAAASSHHRRGHTSNDRLSTLMSSGSESDDDDDDLNHGGLVNGPGDDEEVDAAKQRRLADTRINYYVFELWDATTDALLACTLGFQVGRAFHDCSMATFVRSRAQYGHLLSHAVADIMQRAGVELWYWGLELPYMTQYRRTANAFDLKTHEFLPLWRRKALKRSKQSLEDFLHASAAAAPMPLLLPAAT
jgi:hypothetical protein